MRPSELANMSLQDIFKLLASGNLQDNILLPSMENLSISDIVNMGDEEEVGQVVEDVFEDLGADHSEHEVELNTVIKVFSWREPLPNSNFTNAPLLLWRGDENSDATTTLAFGVYEEEFVELGQNELLEVQVKNSEGNFVNETFSVEMDFPKACPIT